MPKFPALAALAVAAALLLPAAAQAAKPSYYVSLGDSWASGVQPIGPNQADIFTNQGYVDVLYKKLKRKVPGLKQVKLGCGGATTDSLINGTKRCGEPYLPYKSMSKATSQLTYAEKFMRAHKGEIKFVTVTIGGNDFDACVGAGDLTAVVNCVTAGIAKMKSNLPIIAKGLRSAAGKHAVIVGTTYADVTLGEYVRNDQALATASVPVFKQQINPAMKSSYAKQKILFADATDDFGGYIPFSQTTTLAPFGTIPVAVANICKFGWYCVNRPQGPDIHLRPAGYAKLANLVYGEIKNKL